MFKLLKESFKRTNKSIILAVPLVIFVLLAELYFSYAKNVISDIAQMLIAIATVIVFISGFMASWFYITKKTLALTDRIFVFENDRGKANTELLLSLLNGIGKLFLPFLGYTCIMVGIYYIMHIAVSVIIIKHLGSINYEWLSFGILLNPLELHDEIINLSKGQELPLSYWMVLMGIGSTIISFVTMLWIPEIVYSKKNVLLCLFNCISKLIITLPKSLLLFIFIEVLLFICALISVICMDNIYLYFLAILLFYYLFIYIVVLLYTYYEWSFLKED